MVNAHVTQHYRIVAVIIGNRRRDHDFVITAPVKIKHLRYSILTALTVFTFCRLVFYRCIGWGSDIYSCGEKITKSRDDR